MNILSIPVGAMASISFYVGLYHLLIYFRRRPHREDLTFALLCLATSLYDVFCIGLYNATSVAEGVRWQRAQFIALALFTTAFMWFVSDYTRQKPSVVTYAFSAFFLLALAVQIVDRSDLTWIVASPSEKDILLPFGLKITYHEATFGPFTTVQSLTGMVVSTYILLNGIRFYRRGYRREAGPLLLAMGFMYAAAFNDTAVGNGLYQFAYAIEYGYMAMILLMAYSLSSTVVQAAMAKEALRASEERFRSLVETTSDWIWEIDRNGFYTYASPQVRELLGYEPEEIIGKMPFDLMPPDEAKRTGAIFQEIITGQKVFARLENTALHRDGRLVVLETSGVPFFDANGRLLGYRGIDRDVTERKRLEHETEERRLFLESILASAPDAIVTSDARHIISEWNPGAKKLFGYSPEETVGRRIDELITGTDAQILGEATSWTRQIQSWSGIPPTETVRYRKDSSPVNVIVSVAPILIKNEWGGVVAIYTDITERKRAEVALRESEERYRSLFESSPESITLIDLDGVILDCNEATAIIAGLPRDKIIGRQFIEIGVLDERELPQYLELFGRVLGGQVIGPLQLKTVHHDNETRWIEVFSALLKKDDTVYAIQIISRDITERKRAEEALRESEKQYRSVIENIQDVFYRSDIKGRLLMGSPSGAKMFGYDTVDEMIGLPLDSFWPDPREREQLLAQIRATGSVKDLEAVLKRKDGTTFNASFTIHFYYDEHGNLLGTEGIIRDITERKRAEEALRESESRYSTIFNTVHDALFIHDLEGQVLDVNQTMLDLYGVTRVEARQMNIVQDLSDPSNPIDQLLSLWKRVLEGELVAFEWSARRPKDGSCFPAEVWLQRITLRNEGLVLANVRDISERKQAEQALRDSEALYHDLVETSQDLIWQCDAEGRYTYLNPAWEDVLGYEVEEMLGKPFTCFQRPEVAERDRALFSRLIAGGSVKGHESVHLRKDGKPIHLVFNAKFVRDKDGRIVGTRGTAYDITERKQAEAERERLIVELENQNAELERFTYTVSHDLKAPLITIRGFLGFVEKDAREGNVERLKSDMARIVEATDKMNRLLGELLELSRIGRMMNPPQAMPFETIVREAIALVRGRVTQRGVQIEIVTGLSTVFGDHARLVEVVQNLVDNAVKFMGNQPYPLIEIGQCGTESDGKPILFVRDNGIGIEPQYHDQAFGLFNKLDPTSEGTGVGLALVKRIIEVHGGKIWVESELGQGATFYFTLTCGQEQTGG